jgi:hypothetical protein
MNTTSHILKKILANTKTKSVYFLVVFLLLGHISAATRIAQADTNPIHSVGKIASQRIAPGEDLTVQIQLANFGTPDERVDVTLLYSIVETETEEIVLEKKETVAVQTTASFIREIEIPSDFSPGTYYLELDVQYRDQKFPAVSKTQFSVVNPFLGLFIRDWQAIVLFVVSFSVIIFLLWWARRRQPSDLSRDYSHIPKDERIFYEIMHDVVQAIHFHVGDSSIQEIVENIDGLVLDDDLFHIKTVEGSVETVLSNLLKEYEDISGKKANIILQPNYKKSRLKNFKD